jgi:hypothetical protein
VLQSSDFGVTEERFWCYRGAVLVLYCCDSGVTMWEAQALAVELVLGSIHLKH